MTKLLYVEDNDDNVYMLKMRLELLGNFEVLTAENGERGYETALAERPPGRSGELASEHTVEVLPRSAGDALRCLRRRGAGAAQAPHPHVKRHSLWRDLGGNRRTRRRRLTSIRPLQGDDHGALPGGRSPLPAGASRRAPP